VGHFQRVLQDVLRVARAEFEPPQKLNDLVVRHRHVGIQHRLLADLEDVPVHFLLCLGHHLLDSRRMDATVLDELGQGQPGGLAADVVERRDDDNSRGVVHDDVHAGTFFESADVPPLATNDPTLHVVVRDVHRADGGVGGVGGSVPLDGGNENFLGSRLGFGLQPLDVPLDSYRQLSRELALQAVNEHPLRLLAGEAGDFMQSRRLGLDQRLQLSGLFLELVLAVRELLLNRFEVPFLSGQLAGLFDRGIFPLLGPSFLFADFGPGSFEVFIELFAKAKCLVASLEFGVLQDPFCVFSGLVQGFQHRPGIGVRRGRTGDQSGG
jgi:hypothetical protein